MTIVLPHDYFRHRAIIYFYNTIFKDLAKDLNYLDIGIIPADCYLKYDDFAHCRVERRKQMSQQQLGCAAAFLKDGVTGLLAFHFFVRLRQEAGESWHSGKSLTWK